MRHAIVAAVLLAGLSTASAQEAPAKMPETGAIQPGDEAMTDIDPEVVALCSGRANGRRLEGAARKAFMDDCVERED